MRFRLWHLFAFTAMVAVAMFVAGHVGFTVDYQAECRTRQAHLLVEIAWDGEPFFCYDSWPTQC